MRLKVPNKANSRIRKRDDRHRPISAALFGGVGGATNPITENSMVLALDTSIAATNDFEYLINSVSGGTVDWGDGTSEAFGTGFLLVSHTYSSAGQYIFSATSPDFTRLRSRATGADAITEIVQFPLSSENYTVESSGGCVNLTTVPDAIPANITGLQNLFRDSPYNGIEVVTWDVSNVTDFGFLFEGSAFNQDISGWDVSSATDFSSMFRDTSAFNIDISGWSVSSVTDFGAMFHGAAAFNQPVNPWVTASATSFFDMFGDTLVFDQPVGGLEIPNVTNMAFMFQNVTLSTANYDATLVGWEGQAPSIQSNVTFSGGNSTYTLGSAAETARTNLINTHGWSITDGGGV